MLFEDSSLSSCFDFGQEVPPAASLSLLSKELVRITEALHLCQENKETVFLRHPDHNNEALRIDFSQINEKTWSRSALEINELLYRDFKADGTPQAQFSLNKNLISFHVYKPDEQEAYGHYLQILYFFYILNYFIFPKINVFKKLSQENMSYMNTYDEGTEDGKLLSLIIKNVFDESKSLETFMREDAQFSSLLFKISAIATDLIEHCDDFRETSDSLKMIANDLMIDMESKEEDLLDALVAYLHSYSMRAYSVDILYNLEHHEDIFRVDPFLVKPDEKWKQRYIRLEDLKDFLLEDSLYSFCRQSTKKIESRDRQKFLQSNAISFLDQAIAFDQQWLKDFDEKEGLFIQKEAQGYSIYALRAALMIKTYNDLFYKDQVRIISHNKTRPLRTALFIPDALSSHLPPTLPMRLFDLACHAQFKQVILGPDYYYDVFLSESFYPEIVTMAIALDTYCYETYDEWILYLSYVLDAFTQLY